LSSVWGKAVSVIREAAQIVVVGYSMPPTDTFFQYLLTLGLSENPHLHRVVIVNPDCSESTTNRYRRVFARSLADRGRLKFLAVPFAELAGFMGHLAKLEWGSYTDFGQYDATEQK